MLPVFYTADAVPWGHGCTDMDGSGEIIRAIAASHLSFKYQELRTATDDFNQINKLGQGGYGSVYKVQYILELH